MYMVVEIILSYKSVIEKCRCDIKYSQYTIENDGNRDAYINFVKEMLLDKNRFSFKYQLSFFTQRMNNIIRNKSLIVRLNDFDNNILMENSFVLIEKKTKEIILFWDAIHQKLYLQQSFNINLPSDVNHQGVQKYKYIIKNEVDENDDETISYLLDNKVQMDHHTYSKLNIIPFNFYDEEFQEFIKEIDIYQIYFPVLCFQSIIKDALDKSFVKKLSYNEKYIYIKSDTPIQFDLIDELFNFITTHEVNDIQMILVESRLNFLDNNGGLDNVYYVLAEEAITLWIN